MYDIRSTPVKLFGSTFNPTEDSKAYRLFNQANASIQTLSRNNFSFDSTLESLKKNITECTDEVSREALEGRNKDEITTNYKKLADRYLKLITSYNKNLLSPLELLKYVKYTIDRNVLTENEITALSTYNSVFNTIFTSLDQNHKKFSEHCNKAIKKFEREIVMTYGEKLLSIQKLLKDLHPSTTKGTEEPATPRFQSSFEVENNQKPRDFSSEELCTLSDILNDELSFLKNAAEPKANFATETREKILKWASKTESKLTETDPSELSATAKKILEKIPGFKMARRDMVNASQQLQERVQSFSELAPLPFTKLSFYSQAASKALQQMQTEIGKTRSSIREKTQIIDEAQKSVTEKSQAVSHYIRLWQAIDQKNRMPTLAEFLEIFKGVDTDQSLIKAYKLLNEGQLNSFYNARDSFLYSIPRQAFSGLYYPTAFTTLVGLTILCIVGLEKTIIKSFYIVPRGRISPLKAELIELGVVSSSCAWMTTVLKKWNPTLLLSNWRGAQEPTVDLTAPDNLPQANSHEVEPPSMESSGHIESYLISEELLARIALG